MSEKQLLDGTWKLAAVPAASSTGVASPDELPAGLTWLEACVPGEAQLTLIENGAYPDPYFGDNCEKLRELETNDWWYKTVFTPRAELAGKRCELLFEGIDTFAEVWLNGVALGRTDNMFIPHSFDATELLRPGADNELYVHIFSPVLAVRDKDVTNCFSAMKTYEYVWARRPAYSYGWDIAPRLVNCGIHRSVSLIAHEPMEIGDVFIVTGSANEKEACLRIEVDLKLETADFSGLSLRIAGRCGESGFSREEKVYWFHSQTPVTVEEPRLWWPRGYGAPDLYDVTVELLKDGKAVGSKSLRFGIRTVRLMLEDPENGERRFAFEINGRIVYVLGTNWVPLDIFQSRAPARLEKVVDLVGESNCNMIRIWGGGVYEPERLFDLCDERGIMVWQDFMFACSIYPDEDEFLANVRKEAVWVVKSLRNHASLVMWSGDNEVDACYTWARNEGRTFPENRISRDILLRAALAFDGTRPYWPSSPCSEGTELPPGSPKAGDVHLWHHGTYFKDPFYTAIEPRLISEIGHLSVPCVESINAFLPKGETWPPNREAWGYHFGEHPVPLYAPERKEALDEAMNHYFGGVPGDLDGYVHAAQALQAEAFKYWIERSRVHRPACAGIIWWNMIDCWPQFSDAVVDFYFRKKAAFDYIRRAQEPVLLCALDDGSGGADLYGVNDTAAGERIEYDLSLIDAEGEELWSSRGGLDVRAGQARRAESVPSRIVEQAQGKPLMLIMRYESSAGRRANHFLLAAPPVPVNIYARLYHAFRSRVKD